MKCEAESNGWTYKTCDHIKTNQRIHGLCTCNIWTNERTNSRTCEMHVSQTDWNGPIAWTNAFKPSNPTNVWNTPIPFLPPSLPGRQENREWQAWQLEGKFGKGCLKNQIFILQNMLECNFYWRKNHLETSLNSGKITSCSCPIILTWFLCKLTLTKQ